MRRAIALAAAGLLAVLVGIALLREPAERASARAAIHPVVNRGTVPTISSSAPPSRSSARQRGPGTVAAGAHLRIARLGVDSRVVPVRVHDGVMGVPRDPQVVGWWRDGAAPGDAGGTAVLVGHVNYAGVDGAFARLPDLRPGDPVRLDEPGAHLRYRVVAVRTYPKARGLPAIAFTRSGPPRLVLITCGGPFDATTGNYEDNVVVWAVPA